MWLLLSLFSALSLSLSDTFLKMGGKDNSVFSLSSKRLSYSLIVLIPFFILQNEVTPKEGFWLIFFIALPLETLAIILYVLAIKTSPLSLTIPFLAFTPIFLTVIPKIILGEGLTLSGLIGVIFIAFGGYTLNIDKLKKGILEPIIAITKEKGSRYMLIVSFLYAITSTLGKKALTLSSPAFFGLSYFTALTIVFIFLSRFFDKKPERKNNIYILLSGLIYGVMIISHLYAISLTKVAYMISIKRLSLLFSILWGYLFFQEVNIRNHLLGGSFMFFGFVIITIWG
ncbi:MAG: DMT family transporter [Proteobacteria bacterium]|nr:DMT family transporter [Pseudomonadota bacterium]